jgi:lipopolysaccharide/colanic/teichoic acid biosynthesis glycosyltransferase
MYKKYIKRFIDIVGSIFLLVILFPIYFVSGVLVYIFIDKKFFFRQGRPGFQGDIFNIYKFKTMSDKRNSSGKLLPDSERMTKLGSLLRKTSLDELPGLINVLKGEMSFVGPRPLLVEYLPRYSKEQARRHEVKPGITGWAQVNGRNAISWEEKFKFDVWYVKNQSFLLDVKIIFLTAYKVLRRQDVSKKGHVTMSIFTGSPEAISDE